MNSTSYTLVYHPNYRLSEKIGVRITDKPTPYAFDAAWESQPDNVRSEFGFDSPRVGAYANGPWQSRVGVYANGPWPSRSIEMTFKQYVDLVKNDADTVRHSGYKGTP